MRSPIDGRAGAALVKAGNTVQADTEVLAVINQMQPIYDRFSIPETSLDEVRRQLAAGEVTVLARDPDSGETLETGKIAFVDNQIDLQSGAVLLKATFPNRDESLWPGQFIDLRVALDEEKGALVIPSVAVLDSQEGARVFVVKDGAAKLREVVVERTYGADSVIKSGVEAGESVVTNGQLRLTEGAKVKPAADHDHAGHARHSGLWVGRFRAAAGQ